MKLILVRHGHVEGIVPERFRGRANLPLTELGWAQARITARRIHEQWTASAIYCSPQKRAIDTASVSAEVIRQPLHVLPDFTDIDYGDWQGLSREEARAVDASALDAWLSGPDRALIPNGEPLGDVAVRVARVVGAIRRHRAEQVVLVGHDSVNRVLLLQALRLPLSRYWALRQDPCALNELDFPDDDDGDAIVVIRSINDSAHVQLARRRLRGIRSDL
jgi:probable phosphoglycerate mutase